MKHKILVIDDERNVADTLGMILSASGYEVKVEYSGDAGVQQATEFCPDIVISDVIMPTINGVETAMSIRRILPDCRILLFSAAPDYARHVMKDKNIGFEIIPKPINPRSLLSKLRAA